MPVASFTPATPLEVVTSIKTFLDDEGWDINFDADSVFTYNASYTPTSGRRLIATLDDLCVSLYGFLGACTVTNDGYTSISNRVCLNVGTAYDSGQNWDLQTNSCRDAAGKSRWASMSNTSGGTLDLFSWVDTPNIVAVLGLSGIYQWMLWGRIDPFGVVSDGEFFAASVPGSINTYQVGPFVENLSDKSYMSSYLRSTLGGAYTAGWFLSAEYASRRRARWPLFDANGYVASGSASNCQYIHYTGLHGMPSSFLGLSPLLPLPVYGESAVSSGLYMPMGVIPNVRYVDMTFIAAGEEITLGADTWVCYPLCQKTSSDTRGLAILKEE